MALSDVILIIFSLFSIVDAAPLIFGGSSAAGKLISALNIPCGNKQPYDVTDSGQGVLKFCSGLYGAGFSDQPMAVQNDVACAIPTTNKCTLPLTLGKYSFFAKTSTGADGQIKLDSAQTWAIYSTPSVTWAPYAAAALVKGPITRFCRSDLSGSTFVVERYWQEGNAKASFVKLVPAGPGFTPLTPKPLSWCKGVTGTGAMCAGIAGTIGAIGYAQVGACDLAFPKQLTEIALKNAAGTYVLASQQDPLLAIPRVLPAYCGATWSKVGEQMVLAPGLLTAPIVTFEYAFLKHKGLTATGALAKKYLICFAPLLLGTIPTSLLFTNAPSSIVNGWLAVIKTIA